jgi:hypothetical protein
MAKAPYIKVLEHALDQPPIQNCSLSRAGIEERIAAICTTLRGPLTNEERLCLVADRSELRATLKTLTKEKI